MRPYDHVLPDGTTVTLRPITGSDDSMLLAMWDRTSVESRRRRFHGTFVLDESNVSRFTDLTANEQFGVVALRGHGDGRRIVGFAQYDRDPSDRALAEFALLVEDAEQGRGIGTALLRAVASDAAQAGITRLSGEILTDNVRMLNLVRELGLEYASRNDAGVVHSDLEVDLGESFLAVVDESERLAATAALRRFLQPRRIAVVGASRDRQAIGGLVFSNLLAGGVNGVVYPVNPNADSIQGVASFASLADCPAVPDLVIVCVPAPLVASVVDEAGSLGVAAVCIISAGFAEVDDAGQQRQDDVLSRARGWGLRLIGPNCMGLLNGAADIRMNATFSRTFPGPGRISMSSQSGALGLAVLDHVDRLGLGISTFVSVGNKADISGNDLLLYWEEDDDTDVILMYLESFGNPRKFSRIARRVSRRKPIVAVKSGRTTAGVRAASSHTAAMSSGDVAVDALFKQAGVIRTDTLEEMFDVATLLEGHDLPTGHNVAILTNAGGPAILAADALESHGLSVPHLSDRTLASLAEFLPTEAGMTNPVDMIASASPEHYARALAVLAEADEIDAVFVIFIPTGRVEADDVAAALIDARAHIDPDIAVISVFMSSGDTSARLTAARIPAFGFPEAAARALGRVTEYADWRRRPIGSVVTPEGIDSDTARTLADRVLAAAPDDDVWVDHDTATQLLGAYGIRLALTEVVNGPEQAAEAFDRMGGPVVVKLDAPIHKADVGGVELGVTSAQGAADAVDRMRRSLRELDLEQHGTSFLVQQAVGDGIEMMIGVTHDPSFGPIIAAGMGGTLVELLRDVSVRITPLTDLDVQDMLDGLRMRPLLAGYRGSPPADVAALTDLLHRLNSLVEDIPEIVELDLNPVFVREQSHGVVPVDVRMRLAR